MNMKPAKRAEMRRQLMLEIIESRGGYVPSCREMSSLLGQQGFEISHVAVFKDYSRLNLSLGNRINLLPFTEDNDKEKTSPSSPLLALTSKHVFSALSENTNWHQKDIRARKKIASQTA
jgi:hypothetical protein